MHNITNNSKAEQGVWSVGGLVTIAPGATRPVEVREDYLERVMALPFLSVVAASPLDHDRDGKPGGVADPSPLTADEEAELIDAMTDDELRDFIERKAGKKPHHKMGREKLVEAAKEAAGQ